MVIRTFIWFIRYLLQLPIKITMLACRWIKLLTCFVIFWAKQQLMMHFIQNLSLDFHSFLDLYLNGSGSSVDNNWWYRISTSYWVENMQLSFCLLKTHMNLNGIQRPYGLMGWKCSDNNSRSSQTFNLVYDI